MISKNYLKKHFFIILLFSGIFAAIFLIVGIIIGLYFSPLDYQQGKIVRLMYIHIPSAWMALGIYCFIALCSAAFIIWRNQIFYILATDSASIGMFFTLVTLFTGSVWGKFIWGTWWAWDARLTSMLVLFFFYLGYFILKSSLKSQDNLRDIPSVLAIIGAINIPIVKFSVNFWNSLHQKASIFRKAGPTMPIEMLVPIGLIASGMIFLMINLLVVKFKSEQLRKKYLRLQFILDKDNT